MRYSTIICRHIAQAFTNFWPFNVYQLVTAMCNIERRSLVPHILSTSHSSTIGDEVFFKLSKIHHHPQRNKDTAASQNSEYLHPSEVFLIVSVKNWTCARNRLFLGGGSWSLLAPRRVAAVQVHQVFLSQELDLWDFAEALTANFDLCIHPASIQLNPYHNQPRDREHQDGFIGRDTWLLSTCNPW